MIRNSCELRCAPLWHGLLTMPPDGPKVSQSTWRPAVITGGTVGRPCHNEVRRGLSLLEVLIALAVFLISYIAIWDLMNLAGDQALDLAYRNEATRIAQSALARIMIGDLPMQAQGDMPYDDEQDYTYSVSIEEGAVSNLSTVSVTVSHKGKGGGNVQVTLSQMMLDPTTVGSTQDVPPPVVSSTSSGTSGSTGSTGSASGTGTGGSTTGGSSSSTKSSTSSTKSP